MVADSRMQKWEIIVNRLADFEKSKDMEDIESIKDADERTTKVLESYGLPPTTLALEAVHIIKQEEWPEGEAFFSRKYGLFVCEEDNPDDFKMKLVHEIFHFKGINFLPIPLTEAIVERLTCQAINVDDQTLEGNAIFSGVYTYNEFRLLLDEMLAKIVQKSGYDQLQVFSCFAKAHLTGVLEYLSLLDEFFGQGTSKRLNELNNDPESLRQFISTL